MPSIKDDKVVVEPVPSPDDDKQFRMYVPTDEKRILKPEVAKAKKPQLRMILVLGVGVIVGMGMSGKYDAIELSIIMDNLTHNMGVVQGYVTQLIDWVSTMKID
jgi:hypothetical protein